jgi:hypothetical protein
MIWLHSWVAAFKKRRFLSGVGPRILVEFVPTDSFCLTIPASFRFFFFRHKLASSEDALFVFCFLLIFAFVVSMGVQLCGSLV